MTDESKTEKLISSDDKQSVTDGILDMVSNSRAYEVPWISEKLMELSKNKGLDIVGLLLTCLGHLARLHSNIGDYDEVVSSLRSKQDDPELRGRAEDALEDISLFLSENHQELQVGLKTQQSKGRLELCLAFQTTFSSFEAEYQELGSSRIPYLLLPRQHLGQNDRRLQSHRPYPSWQPRLRRGRGKRRNGIQTRYRPVR